MADERDSKLTKREVAIKNLMGMTTEERVSTLGNEAADKFEKYMAEARATQEKIAAEAVANDPRAVIQDREDDNWYTRNAREYLRNIYAGIQGASQTDDPTQLAELAGQINQHIPFIADTVVFSALSAIGGGIVGAGTSSAGGALNSIRAARWAKRAEETRDAAASVQAAGDAVKAQQLISHANKFDRLAKTAERAHSRSKGLGELGGGIVASSVAREGDILSGDEIGGVALETAIGAVPLLVPGEVIDWMGEAGRGIVNTAIAPAKAATRFTNASTRALVRVVGDKFLDPDLLRKSLGATHKDAPDIIRPLNATDNMLLSVNQAYDVIDDSGVLTTAYRDYRKKALKGKSARFSKATGPQYVPLSGDDMLENMRYRVYELVGDRLPKSAPDALLDDISGSTISLEGQLGSTVKTLDRTVEPRKLGELLDDLDREVASYSDKVQHGLPSSVVETAREQAIKARRIGLSSEEFETYVTARKSVLKIVNKLNDERKIPGILDLNPFKPEDRATIQKLLDGNKATGVAKETYEGLGIAAGQRNKDAVKFSNQMDILAQLEEKARTTLVKPSDTYKKRIQMDISYNPDSSKQDYLAYNVMADTVRAFNERWFLDEGGLTGAIFKKQKDELHSLLTLAPALQRSVFGEAAKTKLPVMLSFGMSGAAARFASESLRSSAFGRARYNFRLAVDHSIANTGRDSVDAIYDVVSNFASTTGAAHLATAEDSLAKSMGFSSQGVRDKASDLLDAGGRLVVNTKAALSNARSSEKFLQVTLSKFTHAIMESRAIAQGASSSGEFDPNNEEHLMLLDQSKQALGGLEQAVASGDDSDIAMQVFMLDRLAGGRLLSGGKTGYGDMKVDGKLVVLDPDKQMQIVRKATNGTTDPIVAGKILDGIQRGGIVDNLPSSMYRSR